MAGNAGHTSLHTGEGLELDSGFGSELPQTVLKLMALGSEEAEIFCLDSGMKKTDEEPSEGQPVQ